MTTLLQINVTANSGSHGKIAEQIGETALAYGWRSIIAYGRRANDSNSELIKIGSDLDTITHGIESIILDNHGLGSKNATKRLIEQIEAIKPDIIHIHNLHGYYLNYRLLLKYLGTRNIPTVLTLHDCWNMTGHCAHFENLGCSKWMTQCENCPAVKTDDYPKSLIDRSTKNFLLKKDLFTKITGLTVVPVCDWLGGIVAKSLLKDKKCRTIINGIDLQTFNICNSRKKIDEKYGTAGKFICLSVGVSWKDAQCLGDIHKIGRKLPNDAAMIVVGLKKSQIAKLPKGIIGIEHTENVKELAELYSAADVLVKPTYRDTLPTVDIEALACGTPVVTYDTGGSREIVSEERANGIIVPRGDAHRLFEAIMKIKDKSIIFDKDACRSVAEKYFNKKIMLKSYMDLYHEILKGK